MEVPSPMMMCEVPAMEVPVMEVPSVMEEGGPPMCQPSAEDGEDSENEGTKMGTTTVTTGSNKLDDNKKKKKSNSNSLKPRRWMTFWWMKATQLRLAE